MRGKGLTRLAAGTCSVCICYALTMQSIRGEPITPEWSGQYALPIETAAPMPEQPELRFSEQQGDMFFDSSYEYRRNGKKAGRRGKGSFFASEGDGSPEEEKKSAEGAESDNADSSMQDQASGDPPTLSQFLSSLRCSGCRHNCSLLNPRCMKGRSKAQKAQTEYVQIYGSDI